MKQYNKKNIPLAKELRKNMTPWERKLWYDYLRQYPVRFQRQKAIGNYIVDFYCAKAKLVIELDGGGHYAPVQMQADETRTADLEGMDLTVLRICNLDVDRNFTAVCEHIDNAVQRSLPQSALLTAPSSEGALVRSANEKANQNRQTGRSMAQKRIIALGFFDGVHKGHGALLTACREMADRLGCQAAALTFSSHPEGLVTGTAPKLLNTVSHREQLMKQLYQLDTVITLPFDREMMTMPYRTFFLMLVRRYGAAGLVCGEDFRFGNRGEGNGEKLAALCREAEIPCTVVPQQKLKGIPISSTFIRSLVETGDMEQAMEFLGHPHSLTGTVVPGKRIGRTLGIPTANLVIPGHIVQPKKGVYACKALVDGKEYCAVTNVGNRPTVSGENLTVEPWILDFTGDLYGKTITVEFYKFLRPEKKFPDLQALQEEIQKNAEETRKFFEKT